MSHAMAGGASEPRRKPANSTRLTACGRPGYLSVLWAGERKINVIDWGIHNAWVPTEWVLPFDLDVVPGTQLHAVCRTGEHNGAVWAGDGVIHHVYQSYMAWGEWQYATLDAFGMRRSTRLTAVGRPGYLSIWWAGDKKVMRKHWGLHNDWTPEDEEIDVDVKVKPGDRLVAASRPDKYDGVFWAGDGVIHHLSHNDTDWKNFSYEVFPEKGINVNTTLAACGRPGWVGVFWPGSSKMHLKIWDEAWGKKTRSKHAWKQSQELPPLVPAEPGMPLAAMCRDGEFSGVVWERFGQTVQLYEDLLEWGTWKFSHLLDKSKQDDPTFGTCGRPGFSSMYWAGQGRIHTRQWGLHTSSGPVEATLPLEIDIQPGTPLYGMTRPDEYNGVVWAGDGAVHHAWEDYLNWGDWKYAPIVADSVTPATPLAATGQPGFLSVWWAGPGQVRFLHMGSHNDWNAEVVNLHLTVPIDIGRKVYAFSRSGEHNGIFWGGDGMIHHVFHNSSNWVDFKHEKYAQAEITPHTPLAACGRPGWHGVFWAGRSRIHLKYWDSANEWRPENETIPVAVKVEPGTRLSAMCREGEFSGVLWDVADKTHHLYQDLLDGGKWRYEHVEAKGDSDIVVWNSWVPKPGENDSEADAVEPARQSGDNPPWLLPAVGVAAAVIIFAVGRMLCGRGRHGSPKHSRDGLMS